MADQDPMQQANDMNDLVDLQIDKSVVDPEDVDTLQDLVMGAFKEAHAAAGRLAQEKIGPLSQGMGGQGGPSFEDVFGGNQ